MLVTEPNSLKEKLRARGLMLAHVAGKLGVDKATMTRWAQTRVPAERVAQVARETGVSKSDMRPDLWPVEK